MQEVDQVIAIVLCLLIKNSNIKISVGPSML